MTEGEHHRDLVHEFPELKHRVHELKLASGRFRHLYSEYQEVDDAVHRIEQAIETPSDDYVEQLKLRRLHLKDTLYGMLTGHIPIEPEDEEYVRRHKFRLPVDHGEVVRAWAENGYACRVFTDPPGTERGRLPHDGDQLIAVVEGKLDVSVHGEDYVLEPGDELFIPRGTPHAVRNVSDGETRWMFGYD